MIGPDASLDRHAPAPPPRPLPPPPEPTIDLRVQLAELLAMVQRHKLIVAVCLLLVPGLTLWHTLGQTPLYQASAEVLVNGRTADALNIERVLTPGGGTLEAVASEVQIVRAPDTALRVVDRLALDLPPGPSPGTFDIWSPPPEPTLLERTEATVKDTLKAVLAPEPDAQVAAPVGATPGPLRPAFTDRERVARYLLARLSVDPVGRSYVVRIGFTSSDPVLAARIADAFALEYIAGQTRILSDTAGGAREFLAAQIAELQARVRRAEQAIEDFRGRSDLLVDKDEAPLSVQQLSELNGQLTLARSEAAQARARLSELQRLDGPDPDYGAIGNVLDSPLIQSLRVAQADLERKIAEAAEQYGDRHPTLLRLRAEEADLETGIRREVAKIVQGLRAEARIADVRVATLEAELEGFKARQSGNSDALVQLRALEREAEASRRILESFLLRSQELSAQQAFQQADARIVAAAIIPTSPFHPRPKLMLALSVVGAGCLAIALIALRELFDRGYRSGEQVEADTGLPSLGLIPAVRGRTGRRNLLKHLQDKPNGLYAEALRSVFVSLGARARRSTRSLLVTSAYPGEGKTTTAVSLAAVGASMGWKVLLIDYDVRRPMVQKLLGLPDADGIVELLCGERTLEEVVVADPATGIHVIGPGQTGPRNAGGALTDARKVRALMDRLARTYDLVIVDSPPALALADTRVMSLAVDGVILAVRWAFTSRRDLSGALARLSLEDKALAGAVLTRVDLKRHAKYGYGDSVLYHRSMRRYYAG